MTTTVREDVASQIIWPTRPVLRDEKTWAENVATVELLCGLGEVTEWQEHPGYPHMPYIYNVDGVNILFLPHWGFYSVGGVNLDIPRTAKDVRKAVLAVKALRRLGLRVPTSN